MVTRAWIGGGGNNANEQKDWTPTGKPQSDDDLSMSDSTMNVVGNALVGDTLTLHGQNTINVNGPSQFVLSANTPGSSSSTIETVNLSPSTVWHGDINFEIASLVVNGQNRSAWENQNSSLDRGFATINADVIGIGSFQTGLGAFEFMKSVSPNQTVYSGYGNHTLLDDPQQFLGTAILTSVGHGFVLSDLGQATSYAFQNGMLSIFAGNQVIDSLKLVNNTTSNLSVEKTSGGSVLVVGGTIGDIDVVSQRGSFDLGTGTPLPMHI